MQFFKNRYGMVKNIAMAVHLSIEICFDFFQKLLKKPFFLGCAIEVETSSGMANDSRKVNNSLFMRIFITSYLKVHAGNFV